MIFLALLIAFPAAVWAGPRVAESNVIPDRLIRSKGLVNYNYNVHQVDVDMDGERVIMYRYHWIRMPPGVTAKDVEACVDVKSLDTKDGITLQGKAPICDETSVPKWTEELGVSPITPIKE